MFQHTIAASYFVTEREAPLPPFGSTFFKGERTELRYNANADLGRMLVNFGAEYSEEKAEFSTRNEKYEIFSVFGEALYAVTDTLDVTGSIRYDDHSEFGDEPSGRLALAWRATSDTIVRGSVGTGFRAPSLNKLFGPFNATNPDLDPETSRSAELGVEHFFNSGARVQATAF